MTPFDAPQGELAWMFLQTISADGDLDEGFTLLSDDFTYWSLYTRVSVDKQMLRQGIERRKRALDITIDLRRCITDGETVVVEADATGTSADGAPYDSPFVCIIETRDGLIVSIRDYSDTEALAAVLPRDYLLR